MIELLTLSVLQVFQLIHTTSAIEGRENDILPKRLSLWVTSDTRNLGLARVNELECAVLDMLSQFQPKQGGDQHLRMMKFVLVAFRSSSGHVSLPLQRCVVRVQ